MIDRKAVLEDLITLSRSPSSIQTDLRAFDWDSEELVQLTGRHIRSVLRRFVEGSVTPTEVRDWANTVEGRDDIGTDPETGRDLRQLLFELATPEVNHPIDVANAHRWLRRLDQIDAS